MLKNEVRIVKSIYCAILGTIGMLPAETGGMLGSSDGGMTIDHFYFDESAATTSIEYSPDVKTLRNHVVPEWKARGVEVVGLCRLQ